MNDTILTKDFECLDINDIMQKANITKDERGITYYIYRENYNNGIMKLYVRGSDKNGGSIFKSIDCDRFFFL